MADKTEETCGEGCNVIAKVKLAKIQFDRKIIIDFSSFILELKSEFV